VKVFAPGGLKLNDDVEAAIESALDVELRPAALREPAPLQRSTEGYVDHVVAGLVRLHGLRVVLDCANGAMSGVAPVAFERLGADVQVINAAPDGTNINDGCGATAPGALSAAVVAGGADLGLAFDGDGDRVIAVDHLGNVVDGDHLLALAATQLRDEGHLVDDTVVVTVMSNLGFHRAMRAAGVRVVTTPVGDRAVLEALDTGGWSLGGEQSGHIIYRSLATTGDGLLAGLRLAVDVHERRRPLAELASEAMTSYPQVLINVRVAHLHPQVVDELSGEIAAAEASLGDDGRVLVRASGTEPLIRVMVEAATADLAQQVAGELADVVRRRCT
jgi:phosphoglucosamine mutase